MCRGGGGKEKMSHRYIVRRAAATHEVITRFDGYAGFCPKIIFVHYTLLLLLLLLLFSRVVYLVPLCAYIVPPSGRALARARNALLKDRTNRKQFPLPGSCNQPLRHSPPSRRSVNGINHSDRTRLNILLFTLLLLLLLLPLSCIEFLICCRPSVWLKIFNAARETERRVLCTRSRAMFRILLSPRTLGTMYIRK